MKHYLLLTFFLFSSMASWCIPAKKGIINFLQPDGSQVFIEKKGDEHFHYYATSDGIILKKNEVGFLTYALPMNGKFIASKYIAHNPKERSINEKAFIRSLSNQKISSTIQSRRRRSPKQTAISEFKSSDFPNIGEVHGLILLVQFKDKEFAIDQPLHTFIKLMNQKGYSDDEATGSARDYFIAQSSNLFIPQFDVIGPITVEKTMAQYGANDKDGYDIDPAQMVIDACKLAKQENNFDFSKYDYNNDGEVDLVYVIYAGYAESQGGPDSSIWPHAWTLSGAKKTDLILDGVRVNHYACSSELAGISEKTLDGIGTFCHEFSHCLGLPDLYDTSPNPSNFGMGEWDLMDYGCYNNNSKTPASYSAFERASVGWLNLTELKQPQKITLNALTESNTAYVIYSDISSNEYFILENRQLIGWDKYLPNHGLLITHIDYDEAIWKNNTVNDSPGHQHVSLVPADNELSQYMTSLKGDPFPGIKKNHEFTDNSTPAANLHSGGKLGKPITNITEEMGTITFEFLKSIDIPFALEAISIQENGFTAHWNVVENASSYSLRVSYQNETIHNKNFSSNKFLTDLETKSTEPLLFEGITETSYNVTGLQASTAYTYEVRAHQAEQTSDWSNRILVTTMPATSSEHVKAIENQIQVKKNRLTIKGLKGFTIQLFAINGILLHTETVTDDNYTITCKKGIYLIKVANQINKVIITE